MASQTHLRIAVGIPTIGRPAVLKATLNMLARQTRKPDGLLVAPVDDADVAGVDLAGMGAERIESTRGLCAQRNAILAAVGHYDVIVFFDDDFFPSKDYLTAVERTFLERPDVVMTTGTVIADGVTGPGISIDAGRHLIEDAEGIQQSKGIVVATYNGYGCNMAIRLCTAAKPILFDETLPQYGWLEDVDFSRRLSAHGRIIRISDAWGVHLGSKPGRSNGVRLGYSQIANPIYLAKKGTLSWWRAVEQMGRNLGMNCIRSFVPESYIDRRGRLRGNALAVIAALRGTLDPRQINELD